LIGNIQQLTRRGFNSATNSYTEIDDLTYGYANNRLSTILENSNPGLGYKGRLAGGSSYNYTYDNNGNLTLDGSKSLHSVWNQYDKLIHLENTINAPATTEKLKMKYFGDGTMYQKVKYTHNINSPIEVKDYIGPVEYVNEELEAVYHDDGRLMPDGYDANGNMKWKYEYYIKDHLGNNRVLFADKNDDGIILNGSGGSGDNIQIYHYYPFGMTMDVLGNSYAPGSPENLYQYNGKELFNDLGFNSYNYGARWYDPSIGRFSGVDPLAESYTAWSPYNYVLGNPILLIDPDGRRVEYHSFRDRIRTFSARIGNNQFRKNFKTLKKSEETYVFNGNKSESGGSLTTNGDKLFINYQFNSKDNTTGDAKSTSLIHETEHGVQFEHGELGFEKKGNQWSATVDIIDEFKAFKAGSNARGTMLKDKNGVNTFQGNMNSLGDNFSDSKVIKANRKTLLTFYKDYAGTGYFLLPRKEINNSVKVRTKTTKEYKRPHTSR